MEFNNVISGSGKCINELFFFVGLTWSSFSLDPGCAQWLKSGLEKCKCVVFKKIGFNLKSIRVTIQ